MTENLNGIKDNYASALIRHIQKKWFVYILSACLAVLVVFAYFNLSQKEYLIKTRLLISQAEDPHKPTQSDVLETYSPAGQPKSLENTVNGLSTKMIVDSTVKRLSLCFRVFRQNGLFLKEIYGKSVPIRIETISFAENQFPLKEFQFQVLDSAWYKLNGEGASRTFRFDDVVHLGFGQFRFHFKGGNTGENAGLLIRVFSPDETGNLLSRNLTILPTSKGSDNIDISLVDRIPSRGVDILNSYVNIYNSFRRHEKTLHADSTIAFINKRIEIVNSELDSVGQRMQRIGQSYDLSGLLPDQKLITENATRNRSEVNNDRVQIRAIENLLQFINSNQSKTIPANIMIDDGTLKKMAGNYNKWQIRREELTKNSGAKSPAVEELTIRIDNLRKDMILSLSSIHHFIQSNQVDSEKQTGNGATTSLGEPTQNSGFLEYSRQQHVLEELYLYLLKNRESVAISKSVDVAEISLVDPPRAITSPYNPMATSIYFSALSIGIIIPALVFMLNGISARRARSAKALLATINVPLIGEIASAKKNFIKSPILIKSQVAEQFRRLEFNLNSKLVNGRKAQTFLLTSNSRKEGKSFISYNLARFFSTLGSKTILVECDLRRPRLARILALKVGYGVSDFVWNDNLSISDVIHTFPSFRNCSFIPAGMENGDPVDTLKSERIARLFRYLKENFDTIIIDTPPFGSVIDPVILSEYADVNLFVVKEDNSEMEQLESLREFQKHAKVKDVRIIINHAKFNKKYGYGYS